MESVLLGAALLVTLVALVIVILWRPGMPGRAARFPGRITGGRPLCAQQAAAGRLRRKPNER